MPESNNPTLAGREAPTVELPRELMESHCWNAMDATMDGFRGSVLASTLTPAIERLMQTCYRMGFECGWRIREEESIRAERLARSPGAAEGWTPVSKALPQCDGERIFIGINSAGFTGAFNSAWRRVSGAVSCDYETAEGNIDVMDDLAFWMERPAPPTDEGAKADQPKAADGAKDSRNV